MGALRNIGGLVTVQMRLATVVIPGCPSGEGIRWCQLYFLLCLWPIIAGEFCFAYSRLDARTGELP